MATISSLGLGSGLDSENIVTKLVALEKQPIKTLETQAKIEQAKVSAIAQITSQMSALADVAARISDPNTWIARTATSSNTAAATITTTNSAAATSFQLDVDQLATSQSATSTGVTANGFVGAGTLTFRMGTWTGGGASAALTLPDAQAALAAAHAALAPLQTMLDDANAPLWHPIRGSSPL
jgi:flagellar capping protein FliD